MYCNYCHPIMDTENKKVLFTRTISKKSVLASALEDFIFLTENMTFDETMDETLKTIMDENVSIPLDEKRELFDDILSRSKAQIEMLKDYIEKKEKGYIKDSTWLIEYSIMVSKILKIRQELISVIKWNSNQTVKDIDLLNTEIFSTVRNIISMSSIIESHVKELIDHDEVDRIIDENMIDGYLLGSYKDIDEIRYKLAGAIIVESKLKTLISKLAACGFSWAKNSNIINTNH